jgi:hypothetical protein
VAGFVGSLVLYILLVVVVPTPLEYDTLLRVALAVSYLTTFAGFSFLVAHVVLKLAEGYAKPN